MSEDYIQLPPDGTGKKVRAIKRPDDRYEEVMIPFSKDGTIELKQLYNKLVELLAKLDKPENPQTVQLLFAGAEIDPRDRNWTITEQLDITYVVDVSKYLSPTSLSAGGTATIWTPATGKKIRLKRLQISVDSATRIDLRWGTTPFESYFLPANGSVVVNCVGANEEGAVDQSLTILSSEIATVTASAKGDEV